MAFLFKAVWDKSFISLIYAMIFVFLMVSCRTQMLVTVVPLVFVLCICMYRTGWRYKLKAIGAFGLMFANVGEWFYVCLATTYKGLLKSIFIVPSGRVILGTVFSVLAYATAIIISIYLLRKKKYNAPVLMGVFYVVGFCLLSEVPIFSKYICVKSEPAKDSFLYNN